MERTSTPLAAGTMHSSEGGGGGGGGGGGEAARRRPSATSLHMHQSTASDDTMKEVRDFDISTMKEVVEINTMKEVGIAPDHNDEGKLQAMMHVRSLDSITYAGSDNNNDNNSPEVYTAPTDYYYSKNQDGATAEQGWPRAAGGQKWEDPSSPDSTAASSSKEWMRHDRPKNWKLYAEAAFAAFVVVGLVLTTVLLTSMKKDDDESSGGGSSSSSNRVSSTTRMAIPTMTTSVPKTTATNTILQPNPRDIRIGTSFNATFALNGETCSNPCRLSDTALSAGVSENLYGSDAESWSCGTCWNLIAETDNDGLPIPNSSSVVVMVGTICPATPGNDLCMQKDLGAKSVNEYGGAVNFNLCPGADEVMFGDSGIGLGVGTATRVDCPS